MPFALFFDVHHLIAAAAMGFARIAPVFFILPFLNNNILTGVVRTSIVMWVALALWPHTGEPIPSFPWFPFALIMIREVMVGILLGCLLAWPFWVFHALGSIIDNQRGATLSSSIDPANGIDTSELANFFNLFAAAVYLERGGMRLMLELLQQSYQLCSPLGNCVPSLPAVLGLLNQAVSQGLVLASPVIATLLISEAVLGLLSRFAQQMNAFSVSLTVKSVVAFLIILLYFSPILPQRVWQVTAHPAGLQNWLVSSEPARE
jgi:type III secretion protein SpaR/YscT/HrcT